MCYAAAPPMNLIRTNHLVQSLLSRSASGIKMMSAVVLVLGQGGTTQLVPAPPAPPPSGLQLTGPEAKIMFGPNENCIFKYNAGPPPYLESTCPLNAPEHPGFPDGPAPSSGIVATGGTVTTSGPVVRHVFTSDGTLEVTTGGTAAHLLLVGGGGGCKGGQEHQGGGGAGGLVYGTDVVLSPGTYTVTVGAGGSSGGSGADTYISGAFSAYVAKGGGAGSWYTGSPTSGGSGGGAAGHPGILSGAASTQDDFSSDATFDGFGNTGGSGQGGGPLYYSGGGGGAGAVGTSGTSSQPGHGGEGVDFSATFGPDVGDNGWFAGGGGGGCWNTCTGDSQPLGGSGGGGDANDGNGNPGMPNTGGGCGGGDNNGGGLFADGGSGVVILQYD